jgi:hypothetical protein
VVAHVELGIVFPGRKVDIVQRGGDTLQIPGNEGELRFDKLYATVKRDHTLKYTDGRYVNRLALAFEIQEKSVSGGERIWVANISHEGALPYLAGC